MSPTLDIACAATVPPRSRPPPCTPCSVKDVMNAVPSVGISSGLVISRKRRLVGDALAVRTKSVAATAAYATPARTDRFGTRIILAYPGGRWLSLPVVEPAEATGAHALGRVGWESGRVAGYSGTPLIRKLGIKPGQRVL